MVWEVKIYIKDERINVQYIFLDSDRWAIWYGLFLGIEIEEGEINSRTHKLQELASSYFRMGTDGETVNKQ